MDPCSRSKKSRARTSAPTGSSTRRNCGLASTRSATSSRSRPRDEAPSNLAIIGRYILTPDIFPALEETAKDRTGEIQLTNGLRRLLKQRPIYGCRIDGVRHDTGNKLGFLKAVVYFALRRPILPSRSANTCRRSIWTSRRRSR